MLGVGITVPSHKPILSKIAISIIISWDSKLTRTSAEPTFYIKKGAEISTPFML